MSTTEYIIAMSEVPTYGRVSPDAHGRDEQLGHADGQGLHRRGDERRAARAADAQDGVEPALGVEALHDRRRAPGHRGDRRAAVVGGRQRGPALTGRRRDVVGGDVRRGVTRS